MSLWEITTFLSFTDRRPEEGCRISWLNCFDKATWKMSPIVWTTLVWFLKIKDISLVNDCIFNTRSSHPFFYDQFNSLSAADLIFQDILRDFNVLLCPCARLDFLNINWYSYMSIWRGVKVKFFLHVQSTGGVLVKDGCQKIIQRVKKCKINKSATYAPCMIHA